MPRGQIVIGFDFSETATLALRDAIEIVSRNPTDVLHVVTVIDRQQDYRTADRVREDLVERLRTLFAARVPGTEIDVFVHARIGKPAEEILGVAEDVGADLILVGSHGHGAVGRFLLGSVSDRVLHGARCPVLIIRPKTYRDVTLEKVVEVVPEGFHHLRPHRYSYSGDMLQQRSDSSPY